jgi:hypothetical protein
MLYILCCVLDGNKLIIFRLFFDVHDSVYLGNVYVRLKVQLDTQVFVCILYSSIFLLYMFRVLFATHPQEHKLQRTAIGVCNGYGVLVHWDTLTLLVR